MKQTTAVVGVVLHGGRVLLMHRVNAGKEYYAFVGGHSEGTETSEETVVREIDEETSIKVEPIKTIYHLEYDDGTNRDYILCRYVEGEPKLREDSVEAEKMRSGEQVYEPMWVSVADLPKLLVFPLEIRDWVIEDVEKDFAGTPRSLSIRLEDRRQTM